MNSRLFFGMVMLLGLQMQSVFCMPGQVDSDIGVDQRIIRVISEIDMLDQSLREKGFAELNLNFARQDGGEHISGKIVVIDPTKIPTEKLSALSQGVLQHQNEKDVFCLIHLPGQEGLKIEFHSKDARIQAQLNRNLHVQTRHLNQLVQRRAHSSADIDTSMVIARQDIVRRGQHNSSDDILAAFCGVSCVCGVLTIALGCIGWSVWYICYWVQNHEDETFNEQTFGSIAPLIGAILVFCCCCCGGGRTVVVRGSGSSRYFSPRLADGSSQPGGLLLQVQAEICELLEIHLSDGVSELMVVAREKLSQILDGIRSGEITLSISDAGGLPQMPRMEYGVEHPEDTLALDMGALSL